MLDAVSGFATYVWPPSGIAVAALMLGGIRLWPGITAAAFVVNLMIGGGPLSAIGIAIGNTLEPVVAVLLLQSLFNFHKRIDRIRDFMAFFICGSLLSTAVSATIGVASLWLFGTKNIEGLGYTWGAWWIGDFLGDLIMAPLILVYATHSWRISRLKSIEAFALAVCLVLTLLLIYGPFNVGFEFLTRPFPYLFFPIVVWAALRFGQMGNTLAVFMISAVAVWGTALGLGPFVHPSLRQSLFGLISFMVVFAVTGNLLATAIEEIKNNLGEKAFLYHKAQAAVQTRDEFLSIASHELKTPLASLSLQIDILRQRMGADARVAKLNEAFDLLLRQTGRLTNLVDDLLDVSQIHTGQFSFDLRPTNLSNVVKDTAQRYGEQLAKAECQLNLDIDEPVAGQFDILRIGQLVENLLSNAVKYAPKSSISISLKRLNNSAILTVQDNGPGIPAEKQARLFERFERANSDSGVSGLGLGLFIVREIAKGHNGNVSIFSETGRGTRFTVDLPLAKSS